MPTLNESIDQIKFNSLLAQANPQDKLADLLSLAGYSTNINHLQIHLNTNQQIDFSGCHFDYVKFSGYFQKATFENIHFNNSVFQAAQLSLSTFKQTQFNNCAFVDSTLKGVSFIDSELKSSKAWNSDFSNAAFVDSSISYSLFAKSKFDNVLDYQNSIDNLHIVFSQQYHNNYTFNQASAYYIKPTVVLVGDSEWHDTPYYIVDKYHGNPITISQYTPEHIDNDSLREEVQNALNNIKEHGLKAPSIAQHVLQSDQPMINAIKAYAYKVLENADSVWIPGGPDLHPEFYGETNNGSYIWEGSEYYREILEFSLTEAALALDKPILGICHGSQLVNVYLGGTLHQHVDGHSGITPELKIETHQGLLGSVIGDQAQAPSYHHQAVKDVAPTLEVVATYDGVIKATQSNDGSKVMLCQYHPEYERDQSSENILNQFLSMSAEDKIRSKMIEISDVVDFGTPMDSMLKNINQQGVAQVETSNGLVNDAIQYFASYLPSFITDLTLTHNEIVI